MSANSKQPVNLKEKYKWTLEISFVMSLFMLCSIFFAFKDISSSKNELPEMKLDWTVEVIPPTKHPQKSPPKPRKPTIPVADEDLEEMDDISIWDESFKPDFNKDILPPEPEITDIIEFWSVQKKPEIKHHEIPIYPDIARRAGIEGKVIIEVVISEKGDVIDAKVYKSIPMLDDAALDAAWKCKFEPAMQRDRFVKVRMTIPFDFRLR
jgi:protein TonB